MKYDTSPLSIDTADVEPSPASNELRFVPADPSIHQTNGSDSDSGPISQATVLSKNVGFDTFIESRPETSSLESNRAEPAKLTFRSWAIVGLIAVFSAFAGGTSVYFFSSPPRAAALENKPAVNSTAVTDVQPSDTFVVKAPSERAAEESLVPHSPEVAGQPPRPAYLVKPDVREPVTDANSNSQIAAKTVESTPPNVTVPQATVEPDPRRPEREAKVGAYVVEKPVTSRTPIARCADGTYSFSASKAAACSGRGGVSDWMTGGKPTSNTPPKQTAYVLGPRGGCYYLSSSNKKVYVEKKYCQ